MKIRLHFNTIILSLLCLFLPYLGLAQMKEASYSTGSGLTQMDLNIVVNSTSNTVTFTLTGPSTRWFGFAFDVASMSNGPYTILGNVASASPAEYTMVAYAAPTLQSTQNLAFVSSATNSGRITYVVTRALNTNDPADYVFLSSISNLDIAWAYGNSTTLAGHANRGSGSLNFVNPCAGIGSVLPNSHICFGDSALIFGVYRKLAGVYKDTIHLVSGCDSIISKSLIVHSAQQTILNSITVCAGDSALIFGSYKKQAGNYYDTLNSTYGCDSILQQALLVNPEIDTTVQKQQFTLTAAAGADSYQWYDCASNSAISGAVSNAFTATSNGNYKVQITKNNCSKFSMCHQITGVGFSNFESAIEPKFFPNPVINHLTIDLGYEALKLEMIIFAFDGKMVKNLSIENTQKFEINMSEFSKGIYQIVLISENTSKSIRIIKQ